MKVLISDRHIGTTMWQQALLEEGGVEVVAATLSGHKHYAEGRKLHDKWLLRHLELPTWLVRRLFAIDRDLCGVTHALCSFPPSRFVELKRLPKNVRIIINAGHRIHIHTKGRDIIEYTHAYEELAHDPRYTLAAMSEYDAQYIRYYTGLDVIRLPVAASHAPQRIRNRPYDPRNRVVLVGPSHNTGDLFGMSTIQELNSISRVNSANGNGEPFTFQFIKTLYPNNTATLENISCHPAVVMFPYSAFSISMVELYQLNIPFFVPHDEMLIDQMQDVRLEPLYSDRATVQRLDAHFVEAGRARGYPFSPNDASKGAQTYWLQFMYFNRVGHAQRFTSAGDLVRRLHDADLHRISENMKIENEKLFRSSYYAWERILHR